MRNVRLDKLGRIVIPISIRRALSLKEGSALIASLDRDVIIIKRTSAYCKLCYSPLDEEYKILLCKDCIEKVKKM